MVTSNHINKTNRLSYYNRSNNFINLEYFHNFVTGRGYFDVTINPNRAPRTIRDIMSKTLAESCYTVTIEKEYWVYVKELCKRSPVAKKEIDKQIKEIYELARMKAFDIASYYAHHLSDYNIEDRFNLADVINVTYSLARDWKNIKIASGIDKFIG